MGPAELVAQVEVRNLLFNLGTKFGHNNGRSFGSLFHDDLTVGDAGMHVSVVAACNECLFIHLILDSAYPQPVLSIALAIAESYQRIRIQAWTPECMRRPQAAEFRSVNWHRGIAIAALHQHKLHQKSY